MAIQQVKAQINGTWHVLTLNSLTGKYEKAITAPAITSFNLNGGFYPITIEATDSHGNKTTDTSRLIVRETTPPVINITSPTTGALLDNTKPQVSFTLREETNGSGVNLDTLEVKLDSLTLGIGSAGMVCTPVTGGYNCTYMPQAALADGQHTIKVSVSDNDGNAAQEAAASITIDTTPPILNITSPAADLFTNQLTITVSGTTNDAASNIAKVEIKVNATGQGDIPVAADGSFSKVVPVVDGANTIVIRSTDAIGKFTEVSRSVDVNRIAPTIANIAAAPNPVSAGETVTISVTVTDA